MFGQTKISSSSFKFISAWAKHHKSLDIVKDVWAKNIFGRPLQTFVMMLKLLKGRLNAWNKENFGNMHQAVKNAEDEV